MRATDGLGDATSVVILCNGRIRTFLVAALRSRSPILADVVGQTDKPVLDMETVCSRPLHLVDTVLEYCHTGAVPPPDELAVCAEEFRFWGCAPTHPLPGAGIRVAHDRIALLFLNTLLRTAPVEQRVFMSTSEPETWVHLHVYPELLRSLAFTRYGLSREGVGAREADGGRI